MQEPEIRRLYPVMDAPLMRLDESRDELAKAWLMRLVEGASLEELERIPVDRIARELPEMITDIVRAAGGDRPRREPGGPEYARAAQIAGFRGREAPDPAELALDVSSLQSIMIEGLGRDLTDVEPAALLDAVGSLVEVFGQIQAASISELVSHRSRELESLANTDPLTGLYNLRYLQQQLDHLIGIYQRYGHPFAVLLLDIDGLKRINDAHGHAVGDQALIGVATAVGDTIRAIDTPVRMGGDEFCVLAPNQTAARARVLGERLCAAVARVESPEGAFVGISVGVVSCPEHALEAEHLLQLADEAMYRAKASGESVAVGAPPDPGHGPGY